MRKPQARDYSHPMLVKQRLHLAREAIQDILGD